MESKRVTPTIIADIKNMGGAFYIPIAVMFITTLYTYFFNQASSSLHDFINFNFGFFTIPFIFIWIFYLFEDLVDSDGKECLLSLPYDNLCYGLVRVIRFTVLYIIIFYLFYLAISLLLIQNGKFFELVDIYLPIISIFYYSALSFIIILVVKNVMIGFAVIGAYSSFLLSTRGGVSAFIYPFQWSFPNPNYANEKVAVVLFIMVILFYTLAHLLFSRRDLLMK